MTLSKLSKENAARTEKALRLVYGVILPRMNRTELTAGLGLSRASYELAFVRNNAVFQQLAQELGEWWLNLVRAADETDAGNRRIERRHMEDAATEILDLVRRMPKPVQDVVVRRAVGMGWKSIGVALPDRVHFSLQDDWDAAVRRVWYGCGDCVRRLV
ncbi:hypothetical protein [Sinorhizobium fredii]|uniref:hypothetical protein n=1 Tax=Rhizobium fredii TaxID=380 RepID=UPI0004B7A909|nr:hypothetical protein [Sinorhizobium fredii]